VTGTPPGAGATPVNDVHRVTTLLTGTASISITKTATVNSGVISEPADRVDAGDTITYAYTVTNGPDVPVANVVVTDTDTALGTFACGNANEELTRGATRTCRKTITLTQDQIDAGSVLLAAAEVTAKPSGSATGRAAVTGAAAGTTPTTFAAAPAVTLVKARTAPAGRVKAGGEVSYSLTVTNEGNVTLTQVSVADPKAGEVTCPKTPLAPAASTTCAAVYTATMADIAAGMIENKATVTAVAPGEKTVTASGSAVISFAAGRIAGAERYATAVEISKETFAPGVEAVYVATGVNFPDALAGSAASGGDGPILLVTKDAIPGATLAELKRLKPKKVIMLGGRGVVSQAVESELKKRATTARQAGSDRYSTAAAISASHFDAGVEAAFVATGEDFPDALTGGPAAAKLGGPILLTRKGKLPSATASELRRLRPKRIIVLGGTGVVSEAVERALAGYTAGKVSRLAGADRYSTGAAISEEAFKAGVPVAYVATGVNFPDALAGGAAGAFKDGPVLLVTGTTIPAATAAELTRLKPKSIIVLGGTAVVPETVESALDAYLP